MGGKPRATTGAARALEPELLHVPPYRI